jgi:hypothetical protein
MEIIVALIVIAALFVIGSLLPVSHDIKYFR